MAARNVSYAPFGEDDGVSLVELMVATALVLLIVSAAAQLAVPATEASRVQPEAADLQQRARMATHSLFRDLYAAGAGLDRGARIGPLARSFAAILPRRIGAQGGDLPETARADAVSIIWVPATPVQSTIVAPFQPTSVTIRDEPGCTPLVPACSTRPNMGLAVFDRSGAFSLFTAESVSGPTVNVRVRGVAPAYAYGDDSVVAEVEARTYYIDPAARQLRQYDTDGTDVPVMDEVIDLLLEYFGDPNPPLVPRPSPGTANCLYDAAGSRLPGGVILPAGSDGLAPLPLALFTDGPWCGAGDLQYDADLMRIRRVRVTLRLQVANGAFRASGARFGRSGTAKSAVRTVPDVVSTFDVAPRNLSLPR